MKILSIDIGIKNFAFCLFEKNDTKFNIIVWDVIDLSMKIEVAKCNEIDKSKICGKPCKFIKNSTCFCLKHAKKQPYQIPNAELKPSYINKQKLQKLIDLANKYKINYEKTNIKKAALISLLNEYIILNCFDPISIQNASKIDLVSIGRNIQIKLDLILKNHLETITHILIENQISPIANRMKTIQGMVAQYFIMKNHDIQIEFISSANKLKGKKDEKDEKNEKELINKKNDELINDELKYEKNEKKEITKSSYNERKKQGIKYCLETIKQTQIQSWESFFITHNKKDDLADSFLQGFWYIQNKII